MHPKIIGLIPARGGSKGIPRKNVKYIAGRPLICWTISSAKKSNLLHDIYVSTDDKEIREIAKWNGVKVINRPKKYATDKSNMIDVLKHAVRITKADVIVLLQPTNPVRDRNLIDECITEFMDEGLDSLATGFISKHKPFNGECSNRQENKGFFYDDGNMYIIKSKLIKQGKIKGEKFKDKLVPKDHSIEIDDYFDFWMNEMILKCKR